jgi:putative transposase
MIAAMSVNGIETFMTVEGGVKAKDFRRFVTRHLRPCLQKGDIVCWDNIAMHKSALVREVVEEAGASILPIPRYSPDLNPIEAAWAKVKRLIRKAWPNTVSSLRRAMAAGLRSVSPNDACGWFRYCGYGLLYF